MSVVSKNPFAILSEESFPEAAPSKTATKTTTPAAPAAKDAQKKGPASRGGRYYQRGGGGGAKPLNRDSAPEAGGGDALYGGPKKYDGQIRGRGRGRGRGDPLGGRGGRGERRAFDRHSQTAKTDSEKKMHQGWGGDDGEQERKDEAAADNDAAKEVAWGGENTDADAWGAPPTGEGQAAEGGEGGAGGEGRRREREREPEEDDNTLTLDQYLAQQKEKESLPKLESSRKANEGDDSVFQGAKQLKKGDEDEESYFAGKGKSAPKARTEKKEKVFLEFDARFERPQRGGGRGRGGDRGGDRGAPRGAPRGRGGPGRGGRGGASVDVDDEKAFPSLS